MKRLRLKSFLGVFLCFCMLFSHMVPVYAYKDSTPENDTGFYMAPRFEDGDIVFTLQATKRTNNLRWQTVGFYVTDYRTYKKENDKNLAQYGRMNYGTRDTEYTRRAVWLTGLEKKQGEELEKGESGYKDKDVGENQVVTEFRIGATDVAEIMKGLDTSKTIYYQGILQAFDGDKAVSKPRYTYLDMCATKYENSYKAGVIDWGDHCYKDWRSRYDQPITGEYKTEVEVSLNYYVRDYAETTPTYFSKKHEYSCEDNKTKWTSEKDTKDSLVQGNGLYMSTCEYYVKDTVSLNQNCAPMLYSDVCGDTNIPYESTEEELYLYKVSWSYSSDPIIPGKGCSKGIVLNFM